ncbi:MAG TPA: rod shape-determining protein RodA [Acidimicrobiales bacterium]|nr:rod shape-determining protein RodA [Acidimicrobiales bacterium]
MAQRVLDPNTSPARRYLQHLDVALLAATLTVSAIGVVMVYSATRTKLQLLGYDPHQYLKHQLVWVVLGVVALIVCAAFDYHRFEEYGLLAYGAVLFGLLAVMSPVGSKALGSQRWFQVGSFQLQPSAFAIFALILAMASVIRRYDGDITGPRLVVLLALGAVPVGLVAIQPDLGTAITLGCVLGTMLVVAGVRGRYLAAVAVLVVVATVGGIHLGLLKHYQVQRLLAFVNQSGQQSGQAGYNLAQSKIAIGAGGMFGKGLFHGPQTNLQYVPEQQTDFIFTAVGEQLGFVGAATLLALFGVIVWRVWRIAQLAYDELGMLLCAGVLGYIAFSVFQNAGMTMGIMPITGIPLPLVSYGGSSTIATFAAVGLVLNVGMRRYR